MSLTKLFSFPSGVHTERQQDCKITGAIHVDKAIRCVSIRTDAKYSPGKSLGPLKTVAKFQFCSKSPVSICPAAFTPYCITSLCLAEKQPFCLEETSRFSLAHKFPSF